jgi:PAS domain S-box-containing protein
VKFVFIFFFKAGYDPRFIFELTPLYLLSGLSNTQLLAVSLLVTVSDMILHLQSSKRNLLLSFLPTTFILSSMGFAIMFNPMDLSYVFHYIIFSCLLLIVLIDYHYVLKGIEAPRFFQRKAPLPKRMDKPERLPAYVPPPFLKKEIPPKPSPVPFPPENIAEIQKISDVMTQKIQTVVSELERKTDRIEKLEAMLDQQQLPFRQNEKIVVPPTVPSTDTDGKAPPSEETLVSSASTEEKIILKERIENHLIIDEMDHIVAVIQRGIFRDISRAFADFLGFERTELLQKNFFIFIAPSGFDDARRYYLNRLKGMATNSFRTVLLTKTHTEVPVEITIAPTVYKGDSAEFLSIKEIKDES